MLEFFRFMQIFLSVLMFFIADVSWFSGELFSGMPRSGTLFATRWHLPAMFFMAISLMRGDRRFPAHLFSGNHQPPHPSYPNLEAGLDGTFLLGISSHVYTYCRRKIFLRNFFEIKKKDSPLTGESDHFSLAEVTGSAPHSRIQKRARKDLSLRALAYCN